MKKVKVEEYFADKELFLTSIRIQMSSRGERDTKLMEEREEELGKSEEKERKQREEEKREELWREHQEDWHLLIAKERLEYVEALKQERGKMGRRQKETFGHNTERRGLYSEPGRGM